MRNSHGYVLTIDKVNSRDVMYASSHRCHHVLGEVDIKKEWPNVRRMQVLGAKVVPATEGGASLKEAVDSACKFWYSFSLLLDCLSLLAA